MLQCFYYKKRKKSKNAQLPKCLNTVFYMHKITHVSGRYPAAWTSIKILPDPPPVNHHLLLLY